MHTAEASVAIRFKSLPGMSTAPSLGEVVAAPADTLAEVDVKAWINAQVEAEVQRLRDQGARCIVVPVNNMSVFRGCASEWARPASLTL